MKKIIILTVISMFFACAAFADQVDFADAGKTLHAAANGTTASADTASIGKLSTKVGIGWLCDVTAYAINTQHQSGTKAYGTSYDSTAIYVIDVTKGTAVEEPTASDTSAFSSWKTM